MILICESAHVTTLPVHTKSNSHLSLAYIMILKLDRKLEFNIKKIIANKSQGKKVFYFFKIFIIYFTYILANKVIYILFLFLVYTSSNIFIK